MKHLLALLCLCVFSTNAIAQQMICLEKDQVESVMEKNNEKLLLSGMSLQNAPIVIYAGPKSYSIFILTEDSKLCTGPALNGVVFKLNLGIPL